MEDMLNRALNQNFVPVVDDRKMFIGIITRKDIIKYYYGKGTAGEKPQSSFIMAAEWQKRNRTNRAGVNGTCFWAEATKRDKDGMCHLCP